MSAAADMTGYNSSVLISPAARDIINQIKAHYDEKIIAIARYYDESLQTLRNENTRLIVENYNLRDDNKNVQDTVQRKEQLLFQVTGGRAPSSHDPCFLCGRVGKLYAEEVGERISRQPYSEGFHGRGPENAQGPDQSTQGFTKQPDEYEGPPIIANRSTGRHLLESIGGFLDYEVPGPDHYRRKNKMGGAWLRRNKGQIEAWRQGTLATPVETEDEMYKIEERRNIMTGKSKTPAARSYGEWYDAVLGRDEYGQVGAGPPVNQDRTEAEMEFASTPATSNDPWSQSSSAWGRGQAEPVDTNESEAGGNGWGEGKDEGKDDDEGKSKSDHEGDPKDVIKDESNDNVMADNKEYRFNKIG